MVFCKECKRKVEECPHFVDPIEAPKVSVLDEKIAWLAYLEQDRILEIAYKNGQVWQLSPVPPAIYSEIRDTTLWSFVRFMAQRYKAAPVKTGIQTIKVPDFENCYTCKAKMTVRHRTNNPTDGWIRILWECSACDHTEWRKYEIHFSRVGRGQ